MVCPPVEYDPTTGAPLTDMVEVGTEGTITSWSWVSGVREGQALATPHALALARGRRRAGGTDQASSCGVERAASS
mgnify:CR=1 FL=1